ncbi:MAG: zinc ABC transporter substrate-binding protein [Microbacteriaceae bacterium]|nr:zinc ABC transporter substrate-binding protein [Microbacteriaceae bacterium]
MNQKRIKANKNQAGWKLLAGVGVLATALSLSACSPVESTDNPQILVTTNILGDVVYEIVGNTASVKTVMAPGTDPHSFSLSAQEAALFESAELIIYNGLGLESNLLSQIEAAQESGVATLEVAATVNPLPFGEEGHDHEDGDHDHEHEDGDHEDSDHDHDHGDLDPHFWTDPSRMILAAKAIGAEIIEHVQGIDAAAVQSNLDAYVTKLQDLDTWMESQLSTVPASSQKLLTNHEVFGYFADRFGYEIIGAVIPGGSSVGAPSASELKGLADALKASGVSAIFAETTQPEALARVVAEETGIDVKVVLLYTESLSDSGGEAPDYITMMRYNTEAIVSALK